MLLAMPGGGHRLHLFASPWITSVGFSTGPGLSKVAPRPLRPMSAAALLLGSRHNQISSFSPLHTCLLCTLSFCPILASPWTLVSARGRKMGVWSSGHSRAVRTKRKGKRKPFIPREIEKQTIKTVIRATYPVLVPNK